MIIAIDGFSGCGKSTLARDLAKHLGILYIDTGAMYRATTLYFREQKIDINEADAVREAFTSLKLEFRRNKKNEKEEIYLNGLPGEPRIRDPEITIATSEISAIRAVRQAMVAQQRNLASTRDVVMDGRDIGTVVFPDADLKIFLTADPDTRARRRQKELEDTGKHFPLEKVRDDLVRRDHMDATREESPLKKASDAQILDNSDLSREEQVSIVLNWIKALKEGQPMH